MLKVVWVVLSISWYALTFGQQNSDITKRAGLEIQGYPAGIIAGVQYEYSSGRIHSIHGRLAANLADRRDWGEHDDERGIGWGGTLGYRYGFNVLSQRFSAGIRSDFWNMYITWKDNGLSTGQRPIVQGETYTFVVQPTFELAWWKSFGEHWNFGLSVSNGVEINVITKGQPVGQGLITLLGFNFLRRI